jgi:DNA polymerase III delta prime subunit
MLEKDCVPNLLFCGPSGCGKKSMVTKFIHDIYSGDKTLISKYVMWVNCAYGKGIKFIRENLKFYAKTNISDKCHFKTIILHNAEHLTCDAQSALRRSIEQFSFNTRFFFITNDKHKLLKPILSRLSEIAISKCENYHIRSVNLAFPPTKKDRDRYIQLKTILTKLTPNSDLFTEAQSLYEQAYSGRDITRYVEESDVDTMFKYEWLMFYFNHRENFRVEVMFIYILLYTFVHRPVGLLI